MTMAARIRIRWYQTIRIKLVSVIILTTTFVLAVIGYNAYRYIEKLEQARLAELTEAYANRLSQHLSVPLWHLDREQINTLLMAEMQQQEIAAIIVRDEDRSTLFAAKERNDEGVAVDSLGSISGNYLSADEGIRHQEAVIGVVSVFTSRKLLRQTLHRFIQGVIVTIAILDLILFLVVIIVSNKMLTNPLHRLTAGFERMSRGYLTQSLEIDSHDEIGQLTDISNKMQANFRAVLHRIIKKSTT